MPVDPQVNISARTTNVVAVLMVLFRIVHLLGSVFPIPLCQNCGPAGLDASSFRFSASLVASCTKSVWVAVTPLASNGRLDTLIFTLLIRGVVMPCGRLATYATGLRD